MSTAFGFFILCHSVDFAGLVIKATNQQRSVILPHQLAIATSFCVISTIDTVAATATTTVVDVLLLLVAVIAFFWVPTTTQA